MIGHKSLIDVRMQGFVPDAVFVYASCKTQKYTRWSHPEHQLYAGLPPVIEIEPEDNINRLDFRCVTGMQVHLYCDEFATMLEAAQRIKTFSPSLLIYGCAIVDSRGLWSPANGDGEWMGDEK